MIRWLLLLSFLSFTVGDYPIEICTGPNEEFIAGGTACQPTCSDRSPICTLNIVSGCFCKEGFIRDEDYICIPIENCPIDCGTNEVFSTCGTCDPTCGNLYPICTLECKVGCFCKKGFVRDLRGNCILSRNCPVCYGPNEVPECLPCPEGQACPAIPCPIIGCVCKEGFVRVNGVCVRKYGPRSFRGKY